MRAYLRYVGVAACVTALGCGGSGGHGVLTGIDAGGGDGSASAFGQAFPTTVARDLDVLFMIDDSASMQPLVAKFMQSFSAFTQALEAPPLGLPNIHIAVVSSDLGAGQWSGIPRCAVGGDGGQFHDQIGAGTNEAGGIACVTTGLEAGAHFISNVNGVANYDTTVGLENVFECIASLGDEGAASSTSCSRWSAR